MNDESFSVIPNFLLSSTDLQSSDKLVFMVLFGFRVANQCWASNEYLSQRTGLSIPTIKRSIKVLEEKKIISKITKQESAFVRKRIITVNSLEGFGLEGQNDPSNGQNDLREDQNDPHSGVKMIQTEDQNDPSIDNIINNIIDKREDIPTPSISKIEDKIPVKLPNGNNSKHIFMTKNEKELVVRRYQDELGACFYKDYLLQAIDALEGYLNNNSKKKYKDFYRVLIGWPLRDAKKQLKEDTQFKRELNK